MIVFSLEFTQRWSWGLVIRHIIAECQDITFKRTIMPEKTQGADVILVQQATLLDKVEERYKSLCRLGGNRTFDDVDRDTAGKYLEQMSQCFAIVATNNHLFEIAKIANPNSYLIPNGLDVDLWAPKIKPRHRPLVRSFKIGKEPSQTPLKFIAGFCGNVSRSRNSHYKGFDMVKAACRKTNTALKTALYGEKQIPHGEMQSKFYHLIDCIIHPTLGEGCSNTLMEACACGIPIITTRQAGFHGELMRDGEDCLFCERTPESIAACIERLKGDPDLRAKIAINARQFAVRHHDVRIIAKQYGQIFKECHEANRNI